ncbi:unnamed protein product [Sphacelaria rigidula]
MGVVEDVVDDDSVCLDADAEAFTSLDMAVNEVNTGEYAFATGKGGVEQSDGGELWVLDTGATSHFSPDSSKMADYRKCSGRVLRCAGGGTYPIVGRGNLALSLRSDGRDIVLHLKIIDHAPCVRHHLLSLTRMSNAGHTCIGSSNGFRVELKSGNTLKIPGQNRQLIMYAQRTYPKGHDKHATACAVIAPGKLPNPQVEDVNDFHCKHAHVHEDLLRRTAKQLGVELRGELRPCRGCSEGKGLRQPIPRSTHTRAQAIPTPDGARDDKIKGGPAGSESAKQPTPVARASPRVSHHVSFLLPNPELNAGTAQQTPGIGGGGARDFTRPCPASH